MADFAALGVSVPDALIADDGDAVMVWDDNWDSLLLFLDLTTQWRAVAGLAGLRWLGLDYVAAEVALKRRRWKRAKADRAFADLMVMEQAALKMFGELDP